jgi:signal transduction histidine kinase
MDRSALRRWAADTVLAAVVAYIGLHGTSGAGRLQASSTPVGALAYTLVIVAAASLVVRRRWPLVTLAVVAVATSVYLYQGYPYGPILISLLVAVYTMARWCSIRTAAIAGAIVIAFLAVHLITGRGVSGGLLSVVPVSAWVVVPFAVGAVLRVRLQMVGRDRQEWARRHADEERLRVAQEVHDVVGHGLSAIAMQADIALHVLPRQPDHAAVALTAISRTSKEALDELRATLSAVRREGGPDARAPLPGLARLDELIARMSDSGVPVVVESTGERRQLPPAVDLAAYRVIQESLTNVLRHAGPASVTVGIGFEAEEVAIEVLNTGSAVTAPVVEGHGILGMRHRAEGIGGSLRAEPVAGGGFHVSARLPTT